jgi:hypothetical protein
MKINSPWESTVDKNIVLAKYNCKFMDFKFL